ncbi:MAG: YfiR family protein [Ekhidna sp.]|nr:YfiR family protein [Ekhidna sp.]
MKNKLTSTLLIAFLIVGLSSANAQQEKFKALFIYKFTENVKWTNSETVTVGILGESSVHDELINFTKSKSSVNVKKINSTSEIGSCNLIYLAPSKEKDLASIAAAVGGKSILVVSDSDGLVGKGSDIGFFLENNRLKFLIDKDGIEKKKMIVNAKLVQLGKAL